ncbi:MAG: hypothetical protein IJV38_07945 [Prevotella sp.]|nr:hypothetical protein [Prevotella sp.]
MFQPIGLEQTHKPKTDEVDSEDDKQPPSEIEDTEDGNPEPFGQFVHAT